MPHRLLDISNAINNFFNTNRTLQHHLLDLEALERERLRESSHKAIGTTFLLLTGIDRSQPIAHRKSIYPFTHSLRSRFQSSVIQHT